VSAQIIPKSVIFDLDGTLSDKSGRETFDFALAGGDVSVEPIVELALALREVGWKIIVITGREEKFRGISESWLSLHLGSFEYLFMRSDGDYRPDDIVKYEIYLNKIKDFYDVQFVVDDRNRVVKMWREILGLTCLQVRDGDF
jgi:hypothetical protein